MTQEEKELLLKDLCARLPYGVKYQTYLGDIFTLKDITLSRTATRYYIDDNAFSLSQIKPYLRPLSSMTKEEKEEMHELISPEGTAIYQNNGIAIPMNHYGDFVEYEFMSRILSYLDKKMFDHRSLIEGGLALEAPEDMYNV